MAQTVLYIYAMTNDSGFAPCVDDGWFTLACCKGGVKGGMRKKVAEDYNTEGNNVYVLGLCGKGLANGNEAMIFSPIYLAKIDDVIEMKDYYKKTEEKGSWKNKRANKRTDDVYSISSNDNLEPTKCNPHNEEDIKKDIGGRYVLCSRRFTYWGDACGTKNENDIEDSFPDLFARIRKRTRFRGYMVDRDFSEFEKEIDKWNWFPQEGDQPNIISKDSINKKLYVSKHDNDDEEIVFCGNCGGKRK